MKKPTRPATEAEPRAALADFYTMPGPLQDLAQHIHEINVSKGFWDNERNMGEMLALVTSEISEALEEHRSGRPNVWYHRKPESAWSKLRRLLNGNPPPRAKPEGVAVELADALIRILDIMGSMPDVDVDCVVRMKMEYNRTRPHKHGKAY